MDLWEEPYFVMFAPIWSNVSEKNEIIKSEN